MHLVSQLGVCAGQYSDKGLKSQNEDCLGMCVPEQPALTLKGMSAVIADGVSSAEAGKEASETCVRSFINDYYSTPDAWSVKVSAQRVLTALNRWLYGQGQHFIDAHRGYISTLSILVIKSRMAHLFHIGDSRVYRWREGALEQLTMDHAAAISESKAYLTRAMGMDVRLEVDYRTEDVQLGDVYFLSTDGVHDFVSRAQLQSFLQRAEGEADMHALCQEMVELALAQGSDDNLSCQFVRVDSLPDANAEDVYQQFSELPFPPFLEPGMVLDGYRIIREIHASSRSQLYVVEDVESGQYWVMKTPSVNFQDDPAYIERFIMEEWIGRRIDSVHVVGVPKDSRKRSCLYYLSEYAEGQTLADWIAANPKPDLGKVMEVFKQLVKGVRALHRKDTLHQDLKPDNIVITADGTIKLIDFGSCRVGGVAEIDTPFVRDDILGTATYAAPEYRLGRQASTQADQFSLAAILYEMLTGKPPYGEAFEQCTTAQGFSRLTYQPIYQFHPMVPVWFDGAIRKALQMSPDLRYESLSEFIFDLEHPNQSFLKSVRQPLLERNPLQFWKLLSGLLFASNLLTLWLWLA